jgi:branched-chain amino acid aminotransferase
VACPEGITRATVLGMCRNHDIPYREADLSLAELYRADEVFCTGTMGELVGVVRIDGRPIGDGGVGRVTRRLAELYLQLTSTAGERVVGENK